MKRRIVSIICIMFLLFTATTPLSGGVFSYADEPQQEQLSQDEVIKAAIALYLNERKAWITSTTSAPIDAVQAQMQIWIDSYDFWTNHTTIGSAAAFYAQCIVRYNPFRISLKGPAVRALNDLYNWLIDSGKLPNLESDNSGGQTIDSLYNGHLIGGNLTYYYDSQYSASFASYIGEEKMQDILLVKGNHVGLNGIDCKDLMVNKYPSYSLEYGGENASSWNSAVMPETGTYNVVFSSDFNLDYKIKCNYNQTRSTPRIYIDVNNSGNSAGTTIYANTGFYSGIGEFVNIIFKGNVNRVYQGILFCNTDTLKYSFKSYNYVDTANSSNAASVNFDTDNFDKTDPTPPSGDDEVTYTPEDKTTGDTYNTYNEYITNYVTKNTVINNNYQEPDEPETPGGTTPPWDGGDTTVTPDGDGFNLNLPDLTLPDLNIDWSINGLSEKFPFSIPWDLMAFFTVLNAEPETPAIEAQIDLGIVDWDIDWDLHNFDTLAALLRNLEFIGFCLALILITRSIIKG